MGNIFTDLRVAARQWARHPAAALVVVLSIAAGIGANATVFAWINGVVLRPLPGTPPAAQVLALENRAPDGATLATSWPDYQDYRERARTASVAASSSRLLVLRDPAAGAGESLQTWGQLVSGNFFEVLGVKPVLGRFFSAEERAERPGGAPVVVLSGQLWRQQFQSDPRILGRTLEVNRRPLTVIGVAPEDFRGSQPGMGFELYIPLGMTTEVVGGEDWLNFEDRKNRWLYVFAAPRPGFHSTAAAAEIESLGTQLSRDFPRTNEGVRARLLPLWRTPYGPRALLGTVFVLLQGASVLLLAVVCANVANLLLALGAARRREFAMRLALGATGGSIVTQLLLELSLLAALGAAGGVLLSGWMTDLLGYFLPATRLPVELSAPVDLGSILVAAGLAFCTVLAAGLVPAWQASRAEPLRALRESGASAAPQGARVRAVFVVVQVALALVALVAAGLFRQSFAAAQTVHPGFQLDGVVLARINPAAAGYDAAGAVDFLNRARARLDAAPGVQRAAASDFVPLGLLGGSWEDVSIHGYAPAPDENLKIWRNAVSPGHLEALGLRLLAGRDLAESDDRTAAPVALVNETFARRYFGGRDPVGQKFTGWAKEITVVGVVNDARVLSLDEPARPFFWVPLAQFYRPQNATWIQLRLLPGQDSAAALALLRREIGSLDPAMPIFEALPLREYAATSFFQQRIAAVLLSGLGLLTLFLTTLGLYGVVSHNVEQRTREVGVRMALGARAADVIRLVLGQGLRLVALGLAVGLLLAAGTGAFLGRFLIGISPFDPFVFVSISLTLGVIAVAATTLPARRATRIDPVVALRTE